MGLSKSFQMVLFIVFGLLIFRIYSVENSEVQEQGQVAQEHYQQYVQTYRHWEGSGEALYQKMTQDFTFQFFQFIHNTDSNLNYTHGSLKRPSDDFPSKIFNIQLGHIQTLGDARLQVRLDTASVLSSSFADLEQTAILLIGAYLLLMVLFALLVQLHRSRIKYAAEYINHIPELSFLALERSRFPGVLRPLGNALEACRNQLKLSLDRVRKENEQLTKAAYQDPVSGFSTRQRFTQHLDALNKSDKQQYGVLMMVKAAELASINQLHGRAAGDDYLAKLATCIRKSVASFGVTECFRVSSGDFAVFIDNITLKEGEKCLEQLKVQLDEYAQSARSDSIAHAGMVPYKEGSEPLALMSLADTAVSVAQTLGPNRYYQLEKLSGDEQHGDDHWKLTINDLIKRRSIHFYQQPIQPCNNQTDVYRELLARFTNSDGKYLPTTTVIAMAERYGLNVELDQMIVIQTIEVLSKNPNLTGNMGVNISASSALQDNFTSWLKDLLSKHRQIASRLVFELNEAGMQANLLSSRQFVSQMHKVGAKVAIERFGLGFTSFKFFREVRPDFIKLDSSYSDNIEQDNNNKFFVRMIVDIAKRISIRVIATGVEKQDEKLTLEKLLVDGLQGYYIAKPETLVKKQ
ncbi:EAL domain-containing protein [Shewanella saliphila]|uniref:Diguanylate cyclase n=1 Tax=Shewanella saliphila TaxID=2282698 RepID=A0ABQ2Q0H1_9GAMM|nr:GGDEF domain-containing protein [Shewanella saliphila]MCL1100295.1 GGDEF domain-containing protein [Shewanella saliphila]GGP38056.1 diguanylate cyclase [Shewanella saliphila]